MSPFPTDSAEFSTGSPVNAQAPWWHSDRRPTSLPAPTSVLRSEGDAQHGPAAPASANDVAPDAEPGPAPPTQDADALVMPNPVMVALARWLALLVVGIFLLLMGSGLLVFLAWQRPLPWWPFLLPGIAFLVVSPVPLLIRSAPWPVRVMGIIWTTLVLVIAYGIGWD